MGMYRYLLSAMVVIFHLVGGVNNWGYTAVYGFYLITGYSVGLVLDQRYQNKWNFYLHRIFRILPLYWFYVILTFFLIIFYQSEVITVLPTSAEKIGVYGYIQELSFCVFIKNKDAIFFLNGFPTLVPQAWSLVSQLVFYITAPFLAILYKKSNKLWYLLAGIIVGMSVLSYYLGADFFNFRYRSTFGNYYIFLIGWIAYDLSKKIKWNNQLIVKCLFYSLIGIYMYLSYTLGKGIVLERNILLLTAIQVVIIIIGSKLQLKKITKKCDAMLGNISFGLFLGHIICYYMLGRFFEGLFAGLMVIVIQSIVSVFCYYLIEKRAKKIADYIALKGELNDRKIKA